MPTTQQNKPLPPAAKGAVLGAVLAAAAVAAASLLPGFEGKRNHTYLDPVSIATDCYGHTDRAGGPKVGPVGTNHTDAQCLDLLAHDVTHTGVAIAPCIHRAVPLASLTAFVSFSYNEGSSAFCHSQIAARLNAGDLAGACYNLYDAKQHWTYAGGRQLPGLIARRKAERAYCERGLS